MKKTLRTDLDLPDDPEHVTNKGLVTKYTHVKYEALTLTIQKIWPM